MGESRGQYYNKWDAFAAEEARRLEEEAEKEKEESNRCAAAPHIACIKVAGLDKSSSVVAMEQFPVCARQDVLLRPPTLHTVATLLGRMSA